MFFEPCMYSIALLAVLRVVSSLTSLSPNRYSGWRCKMVASEDSYCLRTVFAISPLGLAMSTGPMRLPLIAPARSSVLSHGRFWYKSQGPCSEEKWATSLARRASSMLWKLGERP